MTWIKLDDKAPRHPKVAGLSDKAFRWWVLGLCYASEFLTDGVLPPAFWKGVPKACRAELTAAKLWDYADPNFLIHGYLDHQTSRGAVAQKRAEIAERVTRYRERRNGVGNGVTNGVSNAGGNAHVTAPEDRRQKTEDRSTEKTTPTPLILSPLQFAKLQESHAYIGVVLRVPNVLHAELRTKSGIADAEGKLQSWYEQLDKDLEQSGKGTGDVFAWLRPRHQAYAMEQGWIEAAPRPGAPARPKPRGVAEILAEQRRPA